MINLAKAVRCMAVGARRADKVEITTLNWLAGEL
jgi:hypothetical protein